MPWLHAVLDLPADSYDQTAEFWSRVTGWSRGEPWDGHPELSSLEPPGGSPYLHLQHIDGAGRVHLDLESDARSETVRRATELGADLVASSEAWTTLTSPGGLPFCVVAAHDHQPVSPVTWPDGHRTRLVQVCIDAPRSAVDAEVAFWRSLLGGRWVASDRPEFHGKWHDDAGSPLQLLFQELEEDDGPVRAHLDVGTDDLAADVRRLAELGAEDVGPGGGWHVFRDPAGLAFCTTLNSPETTRTRDLG